MYFAVAPTLMFNVIDSLRTLLGPRICINAEAQKRVVAMRNRLDKFGYYLMGLETNQSAEEEAMEAGDGSNSSTQDAMQMEPTNTAVDNSNTTTTNGSVDPTRLLTEVAAVQEEISKSQKTLQNLVNKLQK